MPDDIGTLESPGVVPLARGILNDAQELFHQQLALFKAEIRDDLRKTRNASIALAVGVGVAFFGVMLLLFACAYLVDWIGQLPTWVGFAVAGGIALAAGAAVIVLGVNRLKSFNPLPDQSVEALRENAQWIMNRK
jgi:hypothetical protein